MRGWLTAPRFTRPRRPASGQASPRLAAGAAAARRWCGRRGRGVDGAGGALGVGALGRGRRCASGLASAFAGWDAPAISLPSGSALASAFGRLRRRPAWLGRRGVGRRGVAGARMGVRAPPPSLGIDAWPRRAWLGAGLALVAVGLRGVVRRRGRLRRGGVGAGRPDRRGAAAGPGDRAGPARPGRGRAGAGAAGTAAVRWAAASAAPSTDRPSPNSGDGWWPRWNTMALATMPTSATPKAPTVRALSGLTRGRRARDAARSPAPPADADGARRARRRGAAPRRRRW